MSSAAALLAGLTACQVPQNQPEPRTGSEQSGNAPFPDRPDPKSEPFPGDESAPASGPIGGGSGGTEPSPPPPTGPGQ